MTADHFAVTGPLFHVVCREPSSGAHVSTETREWKGEWIWGEICIQSTAPDDQSLYPFGASRATLESLAVVHPSP